MDILKNNALADTAMWRIMLELLKNQLLTA